MSQSIILYTDGSARPNPGYAGWGVHGYLYLNEKPKKGAGLKTSVLTSVGYRLKLDAQSKETEVTPIKYFDSFGGMPYGSTNNTAELKATIEALKIAMNYDLKKILILSDSKMVVQGLTSWIKAWKKNGWLKKDGLPVGSKELWQEIEELQSLHESKGTKVNYEWVKGHGDDVGNNIADKLSVIGTFRSMRGELMHECNIRDAQGYWKQEIDKHPLIDFPGIIFNTLEGFNSPGLYYLTNKCKEDDVIGTPTPNTAYAVVRIKEPDPIIEFIRKEQSRICGHGQYDLLVMGHLASIFKPAVYQDIMNYGLDVLDKIRDNKWDLVHTPTKEPVTRVLIPPKIAMRSVEHLSWLFSTLEEYEEDSSSLCITDITDQFYDQTITTKKGVQTVLTKLKDEYIVGYSKKQFDVNYELNAVINSCPVVLTFSQDIPGRNALKNIESMSPKVCIVTWMESDSMFRYATIIQTQNDISIWASAHSNLRFIGQTK